MPLSYKNVSNCIGNACGERIPEELRHLFKEVDGFMEFPIHVQYPRISKHRLDYIYSQRTVPLQSEWLS